MGGKQQDLTDQKWAGNLCIMGGKIRSEMGKQLLQRGADKRGESDKEQKFTSTDKLK